MQNPARTRHCDRGCPPRRAARQCAQPLIRRRRIGKARGVGPGARRPASDRKPTSPRGKGLAPMLRSTRIRPLGARRPCSLSRLALLAAGGARPRSPEPATVTVRVSEGIRRYEALPPHAGHDHDGAGAPRTAGSCPGTSAAGALEARYATATGTEPGAAKYSDYEVTSIDGRRIRLRRKRVHPRTTTGASGSTTSASSEVGVCEAELEAGDQVLFVPVLLRSELSRRIARPARHRGARHR